MQVAKNSFVVSNFTMPFVLKVFSTSAHNALQRAKRIFFFFFVCIFAILHCLYCQFWDIAITKTFIEK